MTKILSYNNSTTVPLDINGTYTGTIEDVTQYSNIIITINSDSNSIENGIQIYFGSTISTMKLKSQYTYYGNENKTINLTVTDRFFNIIYVNNTLSQSTFSIQTFFLNNNSSLNTNVIFNPNIVDLFGHLKTSQSNTLLDITHIGNKNFLMMDEVVNGGISTYSNASVVMSVTGAGQSVIRQSRMYCQYQPGKSLCIRMTGVINNNNDADTISRIGYFDDTNGLFFEYSNNSMKIVERINSVDTLISQSLWNVDKCDGTGVSGINIPFNYNIIYYIEFAFLGVGHVKFGFYYDGVLYIAHILHHTTLTYPYVLSPNLPIRYMIISTGGDGSLICTCASVQSEGGYNLLGIPFSGGMTTTGKSITSTGINYLLSIRLATNQRKLVKLQSITILCTTTTNAAFELYRCFSQQTSPVTGATYNAVDTNSVVEIDTTAIVSSFNPVTSNSILVYRGYFSDTVNIGFTNLADISGPLYLSCGIDRTTPPTFTTDYYILCVRDYSGGSNTYFGSMNWIEI